jgi:chromate transporter
MARLALSRRSFGLKAAVLAVVLEAVMRVGRRALKSQAMVGVAVLSFIAIFVFAIPFPFIIAAAALIGFIGSKTGISAFQPRSGSDKPDAVDDSGQRLMSRLLRKSLNTCDLLTEEP